MNGFFDPFKDICEGVPSVMLIETEDGNPACWINENYTEMESRAFRLTQNFAVWIFMLLSFVFAVYGLIWLCIQLFSKHRKPILNRLILFSACLSYLLMIGAFSLVMENLETAGTQFFFSILLYQSSLALPVLSLISIFRWFLLSAKKGFSLFYILTSISMIILSVFFWSNGFIGLKLWAY